MTGRVRNVSYAVLAATVLAMAPVSSTAYADNEGEEIPFTVSEILAQLNNTDGDLGFHARIDGEPWRQLVIEDPNERILLNVRNRGSLRKQGLTEFAFESAEPTFDDLTPEEFFERFPQGEYEISGITTEGDEMESEDAFTHVLPAPPNLLSPAPLGCDEPVQLAPGPVLISWDAVTTSHPEIGAFDPAIEITRYIVTVEREEPEPVISYDVELPPDVTILEVPAAFIALGTGFKFQVLATESSGNETSEESCFEISG